MPREEGDEFLGSDGGRTVGQTGKMCQQSYYLLGCRAFVSEIAKVHALITLAEALALGVAEEGVVEEVNGER